MTTTRTPTAAPSAKTFQRERIGKALLWIAAVAASGAAVAAISTVLWRRDQKRSITRVRNSH